jgi:hypothetical protein
MIKRGMIYVMMCCMFLGNMSLSTAADDAKITRLTAMAKKPSVILPNDVPKLDFDFGDIQATLKKNGEITVKGWVNHSRIRCGNYSIGLRFGQGEHACTNVKWLTDVRYLTFQKQCNSARVEHNGFEIGQAEAAQFDKITCAQRLIRCMGACD